MLLALLHRTVRFGLSPVDPTKSVLEESFAIIDEGIINQEALNNASGNCVKPKVFNAATR
jgi:hypothetical protein